MGRDHLSNNDDLHKGDYLVSENGKWMAIFQEDSNFVIYVDGKPTWASDTYGYDGFRLCLQSDCNLVMYNAVNVPRWATQTNQLGTNNCRLQLTNAGNLELFKGNQEIWNSTMSHGTILENL